jgi:hypothetical protein
MEYLSHEISRTVESEIQHVFPGLLDAQGRQLGCRIARLTVVHAPGPLARSLIRRNGTLMHWTVGHEDIPPGVHLCWTGAATRDGVVTSAGHSPMRYCKTAAERVEAIAHYLKGCEARARVTARVGKSAQAKAQAQPEQRP